MRVGAVLWNMFVNGEATCQLPQELKDRHSSIPWIAIRGMRNVLAHGYSTVNLSRIRDAIQVDVPNLVAVLRLEPVE